ncbi:MAG: hypothetical protein IJ529_05250 [Alphaproteobacteria bacterium]|nr:hypothetical protein [Alphaproteobacteria bacterium]MBQ9235965.1 hypothetical protein [Alphaproteobacteria bacterium]
MHKKQLYLLAISAVTLLLGACEQLGVAEEADASIDEAPVYTATIEKPTYPDIRTPQGANQLDLETPLRCFVNWNTQQMISSIPYNLKAFNLVYNDVKDPLPRFEVNGFSFDTMPAEQALLKLTKEAGLKLVAKDAPYASISADNLHGDFTDVIDVIADAAEIYYTYNDVTKTLRISRSGNFSLFIPKSKPIMLAVLDVLRGAGITNFTANFDEYNITFDADFELKNKILNLISYFEENPVLVAYDVRVYRLYPRSAEGIEWQQIMRAFDLGAVKSTKSGVLGRILITSNEINVNSLTAFLSRQARVEISGEGKFAVPNQWFSRFDIGKCINAKSPLSELSLLAKAHFESGNKMLSQLTLEGSNGEISQYSIRGRIGENFLIIGLPGTIFDNYEPYSEIALMIVPRVIKTIKTPELLENNL